jgi:hypothetical protein
VDEQAKLAVILGAGASHDVCCSDETEVTIVGKLQPPTIETLFRGAFDETLKGYPDAQALLATVRNLIQGKKNKLTFEDALRRQLESDDEDVVRMVRDVPLALHEYFWNVSEGYTSDPINYSDLVIRTAKNGITTAFITVNYDTLLEKALINVTGVEFGEEEKYVQPRKNFMLAKLHGSVGWGYPWMPRGERADKRKWLSQVPSFDSSRLRVGLNGDLTYRDSFCYPALALPVPGKCPFICPQLHVSAIQGFLASCQNYLFIGFSANDTDVLKLLVDCVILVPRIVGIVAGKADRADVEDRLARGVPIFGGADVYPPLEDDNDGFTWFLRNRLDEFVDIVKGKRVRMGSPQLRRQPPH